MLAQSRGFLAIASDGPLGEIEAPHYRPGSDEPDFVVVRTVDRLDHERRPLVPSWLVETIDAENGLVYFRGGADELAMLPDKLDAGFGGEFDRS
jgi:hypothetical protein